MVIPAVLAVFGLGLTAGTFVCTWAGDRTLMPAIGLTLLWGAGALALYPLATGNVWTMAAALNHSAFNTANALGPWLAGLALAAGYGLPTTGVVGMGLALSGFAIWAVSYLLDRRAVTAPIGTSARSTKII